MIGDDPLTAALHDIGLTAAPRSQRSLSGGCIHQVACVRLDDGSEVVVKRGSADTSTIFTEELAGLRMIAATNTVPTPQPFGMSVQHGEAFLVMSMLDAGRADDGAWRTFGERLAAMHHADVVDRYGLDHDNHLGSTPQPNGWMNDWVAFNQVRRFGHQIELAVERNLLDGRAEADLRELVERLDEFLPRKPRPSLLHGDLWSGNAIATSQGIAVIDPACSIGDGWADIAMMQLFGGFPQTCLDAYARGAPEPLSGDDRINRITIYQLYHVLNHVNIFGRGYLAQATNLARSILRQAH